MKNVDCPYKQVSIQTGEKLWKEAEVKNTLTLDKFRFVSIAEAQSASAINTSSISQNISEQLTVPLLLGRVSLLTGKRKMFFYASSYLMYCHLRHPTQMLYHSGKFFFRQIASPYKPLQAPCF
jgi:hypothetical protein